MKQELNGTQQGHDSAQLRAWWEQYLSIPATLRIGIWGTSGAGKTTFLTMLYNELQRRPDWKVVGDAAARKFVEGHRERIFKHQFPDPTDGSTDIFLYRVFPPGDTDDSPTKIELLFVDAAGEWYEDHRNTRWTLSQEKLTILDYLAGCHGILFLLDPTRAKANGHSDEAASYGDLLNRLMSDFQEFVMQTDPNSDGTLEQHMAFCISKADRDPYWGKRDMPEVLAREILGQNCLDLLRHAYCKPDRLTFFATAAVSRLQDEKDSETWTENIEYGDARGYGALGGLGGLRPLGNRDTPVQEPHAVDQNGSQVTSAGEWAALQQPADAETRGARQPKGPTPKIKNVQTISTLNVVEPLAWLINNIRRQPPRLPHAPKSP